MVEGDGSLLTAEYDKLMKEESEWEKEKENVKERDKANERKYRVVNKRK